MSLGNNVTPTNPTRDTTIFNINYAMLFVFCTTIHGVGSGWICYRGYDANTNTLGYQIRTNSFSLPMTSVVYRYRLLFQSADNNHWVPATNSTSTNATSSRIVCQDPINPLGAIVYYGTTTSVSAGSRPSASNLWQQYTLNLGYSFQKSTNYSLTSWKPVYVKCALQSNGSAIIDSDDPIVQDLPSSDDGNLYILLGYAYNTTNIELVYYHPVYYYKDGLVRVWAGANIPTKTSDLTNDSGFATTDYVDSIVSNFSGPMVFKGSLGTGGTITTLPAASSSNVGFTYKVITDGTYASQLAKAGDTFISDGTNWILIPSGDEPSGTVTSVGVSNATNGGLSISGSPITSSGTISIGHSNVLSNAQTTQAVYPIKIDKNGHISAYGTAVSIPTKVSDLDNDSEFVNSSEAAAAAPVQSVNGQTGAVSLSIPSKTSDLANDSNFITGMTILSYGHSTWNDFLTAYNADKVVYCRASSNSNPATGTQGRMAFMAYIGFSGSTPTNVEFQYYRSVSTHTDSQQGDQVYIYKLESNGTWSVTVREASSKIAVGTGVQKSYRNGTITLSSAFDGNYDASTNPGATVATVDGAINALNVSNITGLGAGKTLASLTETNGIIAATFQDITITADQISDLATAIASAEHDHDERYLQLSGGTLTGTLTLNANPTNNLEAATKQYVDNILTTNDALVYKGTIGTGGTETTLPSTHKQGWVYKVITANTYAGQTCEIGDTIYCIADGTSANDADWAVVQTNIDGYVIGPASSTGDHIATFSGITGKAIKDSGYTIAKSVPSNAVFTDKNVLQTAITASSYTNWRPLVCGSSNSATEGFSPSTVTEQVYTVNTLSVQPSSGTVRANIFKFGDNAKIQYNSTTQALDFIFI